MKKNNLLAGLLVAAFALICLPLSAQQGRGTSLSKDQLQQMKIPNIKKEKQAPSTKGEKNAPQVLKPKVKKGTNAPNTGNSELKRSGKPAPKPNRKDAPKVKTPKTNNGNANGKKKGDLNTKEFGQKRAAAAKGKSIKRTIKEADTQVSTGRARIEVAKKRLEVAKKNNSISKEEAAKREAIIKKAEQQMIDLEQSLKKGKAKLQN